ncbi:hypothetical protein ABH14_16945 [Brevibacillus brevis]|uniref:hypothetical protein n=1 Tax=Brevibacillus brevis TaxID=1393 RepID=UPI0019022806|nr:hypothetical protein [Brevibacillus brevis]MBH0331463.1 hypothetical protein [Brevibacillus brevis]
MGLKKRIEKYAKQVNCKLSIARKRVRYFDKLEKRIEQASICPKCGKSSLNIESDDREYVFDSWVQCTNDRVPYVEDGEVYFTDCDYTADVEDKYIPLSFGYGYDIVLSFAANGRVDEEMLGESWESFVLADTEMLLKEAI